MRLIDLHVDWLLQYTPETVVFDPARYPGAAVRLGQVGGYLQATRAAILSCYRDAAEWGDRSDPWAALIELIARIEAEFSGRLLIGPDVVDRWRDDARGLTWGLIGVEGFDAVIRSPDDLPRLAMLFRRGVRLFQPVYHSTSLLGGTSTPGDDRGLAGLGREFLEALLALAPEGRGPRPILDLAHMNPGTMSDVLDWLEAEPGRARRLLLAYSHGAVARPGFEPARALTLENLGRLRSLGGTVGLCISPPFFHSTDEIKSAIETVASIPFEGRAGYEGIGIGTDFLGVDRTLPGLGNAAEVVAWVQANFDRAVARVLVQDNGQRLIERATGVER